MKFTRVLKVSDQCKIKPQRKQCGYLDAYDNTLKRKYTIHTSNFQHEERFMSLTNVTSANSSVVTLTGFSSIAALPPFVWDFPPVGEPRKDLLITLDALSRTS